MAFWVTERLVNFVATIALLFCWDYFPVCLFTFPHIYFGWFGSLWHTFHFKKKLWKDFKNYIPTINWSFYWLAHFECLYPHSTDICATSTSSRLQFLNSMLDTSNFLDLIANKFKAYFFPNQHTATQSNEKLYQAFQELPKVGTTKIINLR